MFHFTVVCFIAKPLNRSAARGDLVSCVSNVNYFILMLTRYCSLSQQGHLQPHSKSKAWKLGAKL